MDENYEDCRIDVGYRMAIAPWRARSYIEGGKEDFCGFAIDAAQVSGLAHTFDMIMEWSDGRSDLAELVDDVCREMDVQGIDALSPHNGHPGLYARPRRQEIFAAVNRYRRLELE